LLVAAPRRGKFFAPRSLLFSVSSLLECFLVLRHLSFLSIRKKFLVILVLGAAFSTLRRWYGRSHRDLSTYSALLKVDGILGGDRLRMDESGSLEADGDSSFSTCMGVLFTGVIVDINLAILYS
jgi:hypothetical protein